MPRNNKTRSKAARRVQTQGASKRRVDPKVVATAVGANPSIEELQEQLSEPQRPEAIAALRQELVRQIRSTGGRPGLEGATYRQKVPMQAEDRQRLFTITQAIRARERVQPTPGQVASVLLHQSLIQLEKAAARERATALSQVEESLATKT